MATTVTVALALAARVPRLQVIVVVPLHEPWVGVEETKTRPLASVSVKVMPVLVAGPLLVTVMVYVRLVGNSADVPLTVTPRSACSGWTETAASDQWESWLRVSDMGTLGAPAWVEPNP